MKKINKKFIPIVFLVLLVAVVLVFVLFRTNQSGLQPYCDQTAGTLVSETDTYAIYSMGCSPSQEALSSSVVNQANYDFTINSCDSPKNNGAIPVLATNVETNIHRPGTVPDNTFYAIVDYGTSFSRSAPIIVNETSVDCYLYDNGAFNQVEKACVVCHFKGNAYINDPNPNAYGQIHGWNSGVSTTVKFYKKGSEPVLEPNQEPVQEPTAITYTNYTNGPPPVTTENPENGSVPSISQIVSNQSNYTWIILSIIAVIIILLIIVIRNVMKRRKRR